MNRRQFIVLSAAHLAVASLFSRALRAQTKAPAMTLAEIEQNWKTFLAPNTPIPAVSEAIKLSKDEWRKRLSPAAYNVLREEGTERAGSSPLDREKRVGVFVCAGCDLPVFTSAMKFDSGTGWTIFLTMITGTLATKTEFKAILPRTEYNCARCGGHHGHVFKDGPPPSGLRYCNNGVALKFIARDAG